MYLSFEVIDAFLNDHLLKTGFRDITSATEKVYPEF
jgi:hypothetical protein